MLLTPSPPLFQIFSNPHAPPPPPLVSLADFVTMDLHLSNLGTYAPEAPCCVFYATRRQVYCRFDTDDMSFASTLV